ncbi:MAG: hypothetical protein [Malazfec virus 1]
MFTMILSWVCITFTCLCVLQCLVQTFTSGFTKARVASFITMLYYVAVLYLLFI